MGLFQTAARPPGDIPCSFIIATEYTGRSLCSTMSTRRHPASLLPVTAHSPQLLRVVRERVTYEMVRFVAVQTVRCVRLDEEEALRTRTESTGRVVRTTSPTPLEDSVINNTLGRLPSLHDFIAQIVDASRVQVPVLLTTVLFLDLLRAKLPKVTKGVLMVYFGDLVATSMLMMPQDCPARATASFSQRSLWQRSI